VPVLFGDRRCRITSITTTYGHGGRGANRFDTRPQQGCLT
jgi:hypothetical protein